MGRKAMELWAAVAWVMAVIVGLSAVVTCFAYGTAEVPSAGYGHETVIVWPVIVGSIVSAIYSVLFAVGIKAATVAAINTRTTLQLLIKSQPDSVQVID